MKVIDYAKLDDWLRSYYCRTENMEVEKAVHQFVTKLMKKMQDGDFDFKIPVE